MTCSNCASDALYALDPERVSPVYYCGRCLPPFLRVAASKGQLTINEISPAPSKKKNDPAPEPEPEVVEEPVAEEPVEETPAEEAPPVVEGSEDLEA